jgi:putative FmdB family regulatory protein
MPIYEYRCLGCGNIQEILVGVGDKDETPKCASCGGTAFQKLMSAANTRISPSTGGQSAQARCCGADAPRGDCIPGSCCGAKG